MKRRSLLQLSISLILVFSFSLFGKATAGGMLTVDAGPDQTLTLPASSTTITATLMDSPGKVITTWSVVGGDASKVMIDSPGALSTGVSFSAAGVYTLEIAVTSGGSATDSLIISVLEAAAATTPVYRPDIRIGTRSPSNSHKGDNVYNSNGNGQKIALRSQNDQPVRFYLSVENDGNVADRISVRGAGISRSRFDVVYLDTTGRKAKNVTAQILVDRYVKTYAPGEIRKIQATISRKLNTADRRSIRVNPRFKASSNGNPLNLPDVAAARLFFL